MIKLIAKIQAYIHSEDGATAIEYGLIAGGISLAIVTAVFLFGDSLEGIFTTMAGAMSSAADRVQTS